MPKQPIKKPKKRIPRKDDDKQFHGRLSEDSWTYIKTIAAAYTFSDTAAVNYLLKKGFKACGSIEP